MKKRHSLFPLAVLIILMTCLASIKASAAPIDVEQARQAALNFRKSALQTGKHRAQRTATPLLHCFTKHTEAGHPAVYAFEQEGGGFILAAADDAMPSVLGYSDTGSFDPNNIPDGLQYLLDEYAQMVAASASRKAVEQNLPTPDYPVVKTEPIEPLVKTHWGQQKCYNRYTPFALTNADGNGHASTGCVTTALAQIMRYHKWPEKGFGSAYQDARQGAMSVPYIQDFYAHTYRWDLMYENSSEYRKNENNVYSTQFPEVDAVSQLMVDVAVALRTDFGSISSAVHIAIIPALTSYFNYDPSVELVQLEKVGVESFNNKLIDELMAERPVFLAGGPNSSGHAFVCDGYDGQGRFHINWGWEGLSDGYYLITGLTPAKEGVGGYGTGYSQGLKMVCNIKPNEGEATRPQFVISYKNETNPGYSVKVNGSTQYFAADFGVTLNRNIRGKLGMLIVDAQGQGQIVWNQHEEYSQILSLGTQGAYFDFRVNVDPSWLLPDTRAYYIYRECGEANSTWHYVKDTNGRYCGFSISLVDGDVKFNRVTTQPDYDGTPGQQIVSTTHTFTLGKQVTDPSQIKSNHVYAIARHQGGFAALNSQDGTLRAVSEFDTSGTTAFVISGDDTNGYTIKSAVTRVYMPVLQTTVGNGIPLVMGTVAEKFMIEDRIEYNYATGVQIRSLNSSYNGSKGNVYLNCGGVGNNFVGWYNQSGANTQMNLYEVLVDGMETMPIDVSGPIVVTYKIYHDGSLIGEKRYPETIGRVPTTDFIPYFVNAEGFPSIITGESSSYDIHTTYNEYMPFVPNKKLYNIKFAQDENSYWWTYNINQDYCQLTGAKPAANDTKAQWVVTGNWVSGFSIFHYSTKKGLVAPNGSVNGNKALLAMSADMFPYVYMLEPTDAGLCFHLKGYDSYLSSGGSYAVFTATKENPKNLVYFFEPGKEPDLSLTIGSMQYSTFYDKFPRKIPAGITAYYCTERSDGKLDVEEITQGVIPANVGVVLSGLPGSYRFEHADGTTEDFSGSCLSGVTEDCPISSVMTTDVNAIYIFSRVYGQFGFYKCGGAATLQAHKAYYAPSSSVHVQGFVLDFEGGPTTSVSDISVERNSSCYDLQGRSFVRQPMSGFYIQNGRKRMVR